MGIIRSTAYFRRLEYPPKVTGLRKITASQLAMARATFRPSSSMAHSPGVLNQQWKQPTARGHAHLRQRFRFRFPTEPPEGLAQHPVDGVFRGRRPAQFPCKINAFISSPSLSSPAASRLSRSAR